MFSNAEVISPEEEEFCVSMKLSFRSARNACCDRR